MNKEKIVKPKTKEWQRQTASNIKFEIKGCCAKAILNKRKKDVLFKYIDKKIREFTEQFDEKDKLIADEYYRELYSFAQTAYQTFIESMGNLPPNLYVLSLADPKTLTARQKNDIAIKSGTMQINSLSESSVKKLVDAYSKEPISGSAYTHATSAETYYKDIHKKNKKFLSKEYIELSKEKGYSSSVNPRNIAEMNARFEKYQAEKKRFIDKGVKIVYVPPHANCSKRCQPFQGRVYSLDGTRGVIDGRSYIPIENVSENITYTSKKTGNKYYNGLFSYNCRHSLKEYKIGQNIEKIPDHIIKERREIEEKQRKMERKIRMLKEKEMLYKIAYDVEPNSSILVEANKAKSEYEILTDVYEKFSRENEMTFFRERLEVLSGEDIYLRNYKSDKIAKNVRKK